MGDLVRKKQKNLPQMDEQGNVRDERIIFVSSSWSSKLSGCMRLYIKHDVCAIFIFY